MFDSSAASGRKRAWLCHTHFMRATQNADPQKVKVHLTEGTGIDIDWKDGHHSAYSFQYLRDACPCALCNEERVKENRELDESKGSYLGALSMFKAASKPVSAEAVGKYA